MFENPNYMVCHRVNSFILQRANPRILSPSLHFSLICSLFQVLWRIDFPIIIIVFYNFTGRDFSLFFLLFLSCSSYLFPASFLLASRHFLILSRIIGWIKRGCYEALRGPIRLFFLPYLILPFLSKKRGESKIWPEKYKKLIGKCREMFGIIQESCRAFSWPYPFPVRISKRKIRGFPARFEGLKR